MDNNYSNNRLRELHGSGYEIEDGQPDITGWTIKDSGNRKIGVVDDLLFDPEQQKVRYIIADLKNNDFDLERRKIIIPIGVAELHESNDDVILQSALPWQIRALPTYNDGLTDEDEQDIFSIFSGNSAVSNQGTGNYQPKPQNFYDNPTYSYDNLLKRRTEQLKNQPSDKTFRLRKGVEPTIRDNDAEYDMQRKQMREEEGIPVNDRNQETSNRRRDYDDTGDRLLNRIRRMHEELNEIEKDLRNSRTDRGV